MSAGLETPTPLRSNCAPPDPEYFRIEWNAENQLTRVLKDAVEIASFKYDPLGRRVEKSAGGVVRRYFYDDSDTLGETITGATSAAFRYIHGPSIDEPLARIDVSSEALTYYQTDGLGSVVALTDQAGSTTATYDYDAWGDIQAGPLGSGFGFAGREFDPETGLYYNRARYYDPTLGRFVSEDPLRYGAGDTNLYAYTFNRPTYLRDPDGQFPVAIAVGLAVAWFVFAEATPVNTTELPPNALPASDPVGVAVGETIGLAGGPILGRLGGRLLGPGACRLVSRISRSPRLVRGAQAAGRAAQKSIDRLTEQLSRGNLNPGIGTKAIGQGIFEARARDGARVYFRTTQGNTVEILGKSTKANQQEVIDEVLRVFGSQPR